MEIYVKPPIFHLFKKSVLWFRSMYLTFFVAASTWFLLWRKKDRQDVANCSRLFQFLYGSSWPPAKYSYFYWCKWDLSMFMKIYISRQKLTLHGLHGNVAALNLAYQQFKYLYETWKKQRYCICRHLFWTLCC